MSRTITLRRPRARGVDARLESRLLSGYREATEGRTALLPDLKACGLRALRLVIADRPLGAVPTVFPEAEEQRCWNHRIVNVLDTPPHKLQGEGRALLTKIPYPATREYDRYHGPLFNRHTRLL